jgi:hypothetical protein
LKDSLLLKFIFLMKFTFTFLDDLRLAVKEVICDNQTERQKYEEAIIAITVDESLKRLEFLQLLICFDVVNLEMLMVTPGFVGTAKGSDGLISGVESQNSWYAFNGSKS